MSLAEQNSMGTKISLLSRSQVRYEGYLYGLDQTENTVSLRHVRMLGTEGRMGGGSDEVDASPNIYENVVFRGGDIHDLTVYDDRTLPLMDPAILSVSSGPANGAPLATAAMGSGASAQAKPFSGNIRVAAAPQRSFYDETPLRQPQGTYTNQSSNNNNNYQSAGGRGGYPRRGGYGGGGRGRGGSVAGAPYRRRQHDGHTGMDFVAASQTKKEEFKEEFDFEKARLEFEKNKKDFQEAKEEAKSHHKVYNKMNFFDTISSDQKDRGSIRMDRDEMKKADTETFGSDMVGRMNTGVYRRGGRGGRGRYQRY